MMKQLPAFTKEDRAERYERPMFPVVLGLAVVGLFFGSFGVWSATAPLTGASIAEGKLQVLSNKQSVQHPYGGVVESLKVKEGDTVTKGQTLITLSDTAPRAKLDVLTTQHDEALAEEARLIAERDDRAEPAFDQTLVARKGERTVAQLLANERAVMAARSRQYHAQMDGLDKRVAELSAQMDGLKAELRGIAAQQAILTEERDDSQKLFDKGYTPKTRILGLERSRAELDTSTASKRADVARTEEAIAGAKLETAKAERERITGITGDLSKDEAKLVELAPQIGAARDVLTRTKITAPASGTVVGLQIFTEAGVIQAGAKLLDIVPEKMPLIAQVKLPLNDLSDVAAGRKADVRLTGVPRNERPRIAGDVMTDSADRMDDEKGGKSFYSMRVRLDPKDVEASKFQLQAGMPVEVVVNSRDRTMLTYLVGPVIEEITHAFREH